MSVADVDNYVKTQLEAYTGLKVKSYSSVTGTVIFDDGSIFGINRTATAQRLVALKVDGVAKEYAKYNLGSTQSVTVPGLTAGSTYLLKSNLVKSSTPDMTAGSAYTVPTNTTADVEFVTAYTVTHTLGSNLTYDNAGVPTALTTGDYVQKGLVLTASIAADSDYHQLVVNGTPTGSAKKGDGSNPTTFTYTVGGTVTSMSISTGYMVKVDGREIGVYSASDVATFTGFKPGATFAAVGKNEVSGAESKAYIAVATGALSENSTGLHYTVNAGDADNGVIELVQVAKIVYSAGDFDGTNPMYFLKSDGATKQNVGNNEFVVVGTSLVATANDAQMGENVKVELDGSGSAVAVPGGTTGTGPVVATATYQVSDTAHEVEFTVAT